MGARSALATMRQRILRVPKTPKIVGAVVTAASTVRHAAVHAAHASKIPAALTTVSGSVQQTLTRTARTPAFGVVTIACLVFAGPVGAAAPPFPMPKSTLRDAAITPVAAVARASTDPTGPLVVAVQHPKIGFHIAAATVSAPPPTMVVNTPGALGIPMMALSAYRNAERMMAVADPGCGISWNLLAGIGRIESGHANGGATDARGTAVRPIYGPALDGTLPGNEVIVQSGAGGRVSYARAMGPMQFLPGTWARYASDGDGDGVADPQNIYDATLANSFDGEYEMLYGSDAAVMMRESRAWMFKEVDSPLLGWEVYAAKLKVFNETGIALVAGASKPPPVDKQGQPLVPDPLTTTPLFYALSNFLLNADELTKKAEAYKAAYGEDDVDGLMEELGKARQQATVKRPAAGYLEGFQAVVTAVKANEAILAGKRIELKPELYELK